MLSALKHVPSHPIAHPEPALPDAWRGVLNRLRVVALQCRVAARADLFQACAMISSTQRPHADIHAEALFRCLPQAMGKRELWFRPGTQELSFDESWLMRAVIAASQDDGDSLTFLIRSRISRQYQRQIAFLIKGIARQNAQV